jgi:hypothetical protein
MDETWLRFSLAALAVWRVTHAIVYEDGPWIILLRLRRMVGNAPFGQWMDCFQCASIWFAAPFAVFVAQGAFESSVAWLALSGAACLIDRFVHPPVLIQPVNSEGANDAVLRTGEGGTQSEYERDPTPEPKNGGQHAGY